MTRASLLHILDHVNGISDAEVRELEQLAAAFPYCQTAHILLAKAAHDRGSMLAGQRLRRAATYAVDRELLRQLLDRPAVAVAVPAAAQPREVPQPVVVPEAALPEAAAGPAPGAVLPPIPEPEQPAPLPLPASPNSGEPAAAIDDAATPALLYETLPPAAEALLPAPEPPVAEAADESRATDVDTATQPASSELSAQDPAHPAATPTAGTPEAEAPDEDLLPAMAPPIRPPAEAGISRFEFGLSEPELPVPSGYQLPDLDEDEESELPSVSSLASDAAAVTTPFRADSDLGYSLGVGSRLGYDLQAHDGYTLDLPLDAFFEPDALLLAHLKAHRPKPSASSFDLINRFLKTQPRIKTPAGMPLPAEEQPDLSVRSTATAPALASESLARIMVRQGKKDKAIEIYERLMERQPEKKAYFAEQIQQLQQPSE